MKKLLLILVLCTVAVFTACNKEEEPEKIILGMASGFPPFNFLANDGSGVIGRYSGVSVALVSAIAEELGIEVVVRDQDFDGLIAALLSGEIDVIAAGMTITEERLQQVNFSIPYFDARQTVLVLSSNTTIQKTTDLEGLSVGVQLGTTGEISMSDTDKVDVEIVSYINVVTGILELLAGRIDAFVVDSPVAKGFVAEYPNQLRMFYDDDFFEDEKFGMAFNKNNVDLLNRFNTVLERLLAEGYADMLYDKYMKELGLD